MLSDHPSYQDLLIADTRRLVAQSHALSEQAREIVRTAKEVRTRIDGRYTAENEPLLAVAAQPR